MSDQSSVLLSPTLRASLVSLLSRCEAGNVQGFTAFRETDEATGDSIWTVYVHSSDHLLLEKESIKIVSAFRKRP